jgi:hypothetical protein
MKNISSEKVRELLSNWFKTSGCKDIKFWINPKSLVTKEDCEAQVQAAISGHTKANPAPIPHSDLFKKFCK